METKEKIRKELLIYLRGSDSTRCVSDESLDLIDRFVDYSQQSTKHLQDRIAELTKVLSTCEKTFELLNQIVFNLKAAADGDNLKDMIEAVDIDFPLIQAKIKDTLLNTKS